MNQDKQARKAQEEDFAKIQEEKRLASIRSFRLAALEPYDGFVDSETLNAIDTCSIQVFEYILSTAKADKEAWEEEQRREEEEQARKAAEKARAEQARKEEDARKAKAAPDRDKLEAWAEEIGAAMRQAPLCATEEGRTLTAQTLVVIAAALKRLSEEMKEM